VGHIPIPPRPRPSYAAQVREAYVAGKIDVDVLERDLRIAIALDEDWWHLLDLPLAHTDAPLYLRDRDGRLLFTPPALFAWASASRA
jgi:hypothetical protein